MKFIFALIFIACSVCLLGTTEAAPELRQKRSLSQERCPGNVTETECLEYAVEKSKTISYCHKFFVNGNSIEWQSCGWVKCGENTIFVEEDRNKPYPECCSRCDVIDPTKPYTSSGVM